ncbi:hypothetical protein Csa_002071 [Cucumis sativus]|nr:hypothetical protein Csa_002071 [Cucumis sativus]
MAATKGLMFVLLLIAFAMLLMESGQMIVAKLVMRGADYRRGRRSVRGHVEPVAVAVNAFRQALQATMIFVPAMLI